VSTNPTKGMAILEKKIGIESLNRYNLDVFLVLPILIP